LGISMVTSNSVNPVSSTTPASRPIDDELSSSSP
jgi:hypothetical protein